MNQSATFRKLGDFTATARMIPLSLLAMGIGDLSTYVAYALLKLIGFFTNLFYFGRLEHRTGLAGGESSGMVGGAGSGGGRASDRTDGALRIGADSRSWDTGSD